MTKRAKKVLLIAAASVAGLVVVLAIASIIVLKSSWFANFAKDKIVAELEDATGGVATIGSFEFDLSHLTIRIHDFVLHGTEPKSAAPLLYVQLLELRMKLFSGIMHTLDLAYLGIEKPQVDLIISPDGKTNIPQPKNPAKPSGNNNTLETVVNLKVNKFLLENGLIVAADQKSAFNARGENLRVLLNYDFAHPSYSGNLAIAPLRVTSSAKAPLDANVNIPVTIQPDAIRIDNASIATPQSQIRLTASLTNMNAPIISASMNAGISLPEMQRGLALPIDASAKGAPQTLTAELAVQLNEKTKALQIQTAHIALGQTTFQASGAVNPGQNGGVQFNANLALGQLSRLMNVSSVQAEGNLVANGTATLDAHDDYAVNGTLNSRGLAVRSGTTHISDVSLYSPFHADPYLISLDGIKLNAFGGSLAAKVFVEKMQQLSVEGGLRNFSLPVLASAFTGKQLGYDGVLEGSLKAQGNLKAKGTTGYSADAHLAIVPGTHGVPISGRITANYAGATGIVALGQSYVSLPNSRIDLTGSLNHRIDISLVSHNLNDFLPAANLASSTPEKSLPISLSPGGAASVQAQITGDISDPRIAGHMGMTNFMAEQKPFNGFSLDLAASPFGASIQNGNLTGQDLQTTFDARIGLWKWRPLPRSPLAANLKLRSNDLGSVLALAGESSLQARGQLKADVHVNGTYGNPTGNAVLQVLDGSVDQQPFKKLYAGVNLGDQLITLSNVELDTAGGRITASGTFRHPKDSFTVGHAQFHIASIGVQLADITPLQQRSPGTAGTIQLSANAAANLTNAGGQTEVTVSDINADFAAHGLRVQNQSAGDLTGTARTNNGTVNYNVSSDFASSAIRISGRTALAKNYPTTADASIQNLSLSKTLQITGETQYPVSGNFSANAHVSGTLKSPNANLSFTLSRASVYQEPINRLQGTIDYSDTRVQIPSVSLDVPAGNVTLSGSFSHPANNFNAGALDLKVNSTPIQLAKIRHLEQQEPSFTGTLTFAANLAASLRDHNGNREVRFSNLDANVTASALRLNDKDLGQATFIAGTTGESLNYRFDSDIAQSQIHAQGVSQLSGDYVTRADLTFSNIRYSNIQPFISTEAGPEQLFDASLAGQASVNGPLLKVDDLAARLQLNQLNVQTHPKASPTGGPALRTVDLQNQGPIVVTLDHGTVRVQQLKISGPDTNITASGGINLKNGNNPLGLTLAANLNLAILQDIDREFYSSGLVAVDATVRGSFSKPLVNGQVVLKGANVNYTQSPNGLSNANGTILLNGTSATIQTLTAESGGGKIALTGFVAFGGPVMSYNLRAGANRVRVRYSGIDVVSNSTITLIGNANRSLLGGTVTLQRIAYNSTSDVGSILSSASTPPSAPSNPSSLLAGMRLNIHILTAPDLQVVSTFTDKLEIFADMTVRGTAANPGILGRVHITNGQLVFFGNTYTVDTGGINFYNPNSIEPIIDISLETIAQGVDVIIGVSGSMDDLKLSYRSDPPLTFEQIVQLLATNTTPANPQVAAHEPTPPQQSLSQMGESAVLGQAIANPLASRVQRVFGLTDFKIDPSVAGNNGQPSARITLQQKITSNITFTYIQDVTQANSEIVRVEFDLTNKLSAVALRDYNGNVSVEFFYKFKRR